VVEVGAEQEQAAVLVTVRDHGIGIPAKDIDQVFERYFRGSNVTGIVGTGVGLYLAKMVVESHGGVITVESHEGQGSTFMVRLPLRPELKDMQPSMLPAVSERGDERVASGAQLR
jgi:signal transduction histidine kinase